MKKTLIASAVAAATLSTTTLAMDPATALAERLDSKPEIYGNVQLAHFSTDVDTGTTETSTNEFSDNGSTLGFKHSHEISQDLEGYYKAEVEFAADEDTGSPFNKLDEAYVGVRGDFGSVQVGRDEEVYDWVDVVDTFEAVGLSSPFSGNQDDNAQYVSPTVADSLMFGVTMPIDSDTNFGGALAAQYSMDNISASLSYMMGREEGGVDAEDVIGLGFTFGMDDLSLMAQYETQKDSLDYFALQGSYAMGANTFVLGYGLSSFDSSTLEDQSEIYLQAMHSLSDHMYVYLEYKDTTDVGGTDGTDQSDLAIGTAYSF